VKLRRSLLTSESDYPINELAIEVLFFGWFIPTHRRRKLPGKRR